MKFIAPLLALIAAVFAQNNAINIPPGGLQVTAGQPLTITWSDPSSGTVTIKLQQGSSITPDSGITLETSVPASDKTATFTIDPSTVNTSQYTIEIIDNTNPSNYNFSPNFDIAGATCSGTCDGSATTSGSASSTGTATSTGTDSSTATNSSSASASSASVSSSSASASSSVASSLSASASSAAASSSSAASASNSAAATTSAPNAGGAGAVKAQAGLVVALVAAVAVF